MILDEAEAPLDPVSDIDGFMLACLVDASSGMVLLLEALLAEVARRQRVLKQLSAALTADTALARNPHIRQGSIRVSALQRALLIRVRHGSTPRDLAWDLSRSVFCTTAEVYKLLVWRLMSFVRAVSVEKGETVPINNTDVASGGAD